MHLPDNSVRGSALAFVDAARTPHGYMLGGIAWGLGWCRWFSVELAEGSTPLIPWGAGNAINEAESLAATVIMEALESFVSNTDVLLFIDNAAAEGTLLKSYSSSKHLTVLAALFWSAVRKAKAAAWVGRVPSRLNVADGFGRGDFAVAHRLGATRLRVALPLVDKWAFLLEDPSVPKSHKKMRRQRVHQGQPNNLTWSLEVLDVINTTDKEQH